jgi:hypothetical protein
MIDYFTIEEFNHFQFIIISAKIIHPGKIQNAAKINSLYPEPDIVINYQEYGDKEKMFKELMAYYKPDAEDLQRMKQGNSYWLGNEIYRAIVNPLLMHNDLVIICDRTENDYIECLCKFLKKEYKIDCIDLNELFITGHVGPYYIDRDEIRNKAVDLRRAAAKDEADAINSTRNGRISTIRNMTKKEKIKMLKHFGVSIRADELKDINQILLETWCDEEPLSREEDD